MSSPRFGPGVRGGRQWQPAAEPDSTTSAFSTTSFDSYSEEGTRRDTAYSDHEIRDRTLFTAEPERRNARDSSRDVTRDSSESERDVTVISNRKDVTFYSREGETSTDTERQGSYDFRFPDHEEKMEWSCDEAGSWQQLSFVMLIISFLGHGLAVCTPYWVVGWHGDQMSLYEGVWLSCYREKGVGRWICSTFDTIRNLFEQPVWYEACQVSAVLSVVLLMPALLVASLYSYAVALRGRSRASWLLIIFLASSGFCSFLSLAIFSAAYPFHQTFPVGRVRYHASFALQIISFFLCFIALLAHLRDSYPHLRVWENKLCGSNRLPACGPSMASCAGGGKVHIQPPRKTTGAAPARGVPKLTQFSLPKLPSALSRWAKREKPLAPPLERIEEVADGRETTAAPVSPAEPVFSPGRDRGAGNKAKSSAASSDSMSGYDSQV